MAIKKRKAFTLLELLLSSALFVSAMVGVIAVVSSSVSTISQTLKIKNINSTLRNVNEYFAGEIHNAKCFKTSDESAYILNFFDSGCNNLEKVVYINKNGRLVEKKSSEDEQYLTPENITVTNIDENTPVFVSSDNSLVEIKFNISVSGDEVSSTDYSTSFTRRLW